jgi:hypothetical protein
MITSILLLDGSIVGEEFEFALPPFFDTWVVPFHTLGVPTQGMHLLMVGNSMVLKK